MRNEKKEGKSSKMDEQRVVVAVLLLSIVMLTACLVTALMIR